MMTTDPESTALRQAFDLARLGRYFATPLQALAHPIYGLVLRAAYKHALRRREPIA